MGAVFFEFCLRGRQSGRMCRKRVFFDVLIHGFFCGIARNSNGWNIRRSMGREYGMGSTFSNFGLIDCKSTKKSTILNIKVILRKYKCHQKIIGYDLLETILATMV